MLFPQSFLKFEIKWNNHIKLSFWEKYSCQIKEIQFYFLYENDRAIS